MSKTIPLTKGQFAVVDDDDYERVSQYSWYCQKQKHYTAYAVRTVQGKRVPNAPRPKTMVYLHRYIMGVDLDVFVDHKNGDGLDCRKDNLRISTSSQNMHNQGPRKNNTSGYKGVTFNKKRGRWAAQITFNRHTKALGRFNTIEEAVAAYDAASEAYHGDYGYKNCGPDKNTESHGCDA